MASEIGNWLQKKKKAVSRVFNCYLGHSGSGEGCAVAKSGLGALQAWSASTRVSRAVERLDGASICRLPPPATALGTIGADDLGTRREDALGDDMRLAGTAAVILHSPFSSSLTVPSSQSCRPRSLPETSSRLRSSCSSRSRTALSTCRLRWFRCLSTPTQYAPCAAIITQC